MKYLLLLLVPFFFFGCAEQQLIPKQIIITGYDFSKYANQGFLFTTDIYRGEYDGMGVLNLTSYPDARLLDYQEIKTHSWNSDGDVQKNLFIEKNNINEALDSLYACAKRLGADAVVRLKIDVQYYTYSYYSVPYIVMEGLAIRRRPMNMKLSGEFAD